MKLIINASSIYKGGAEQVVLSFINECIQWRENEYHVVLRENISGQLNFDDFPSNFTFYDIKRRPGSGIITYFKEMRRFRSLEEKIKPDCVISTGGHGYWRPSAPLVSGFNIPHFIYPESPYFSQISFRRKLFWAFKKLIHMRFYGRADALVVQTDDVNRRLKAYFPGIPVHTVSNTVNSCFKNPASFPGKLPDRDPGEIRLLTLSSWYPHKNIGIIRKLTDLYEKQGIKHIKFVLTLPDEIFKREFPEKYHCRIYNVGPVPIRECPSLYKECDFMFLPSLLECFSASYAEAMMMERPILTSDLGFAHTVCGDAAVYFNPVDASDIVRKINDLIVNPQLQTKMKKEGQSKLGQLNSASDRASTFLSICKELVANGKN